MQIWLSEIATSPPPIKWEEHLFASPLQSLKETVKCVQRSFYVCLCPKTKRTPAIIFWWHIVTNNNILVTGMTESNFAMSYTAEHVMLYLWSLYLAEVAATIFSDYGFCFYAFPSVFPFDCSWSCDMRSGKLKSLSDFLEYHHFKMNKHSWRQPVGSELM